MWYTSYALICIYFDISQDLPDGIELTWDDEQWFQSIDYEQIPFRCIRFHEHGHLFWDYTQNKITGGRKDQENQDVKGFTKVPNKKRPTKKPTGPEINKRVQTQNKFEVLQDVKMSNNQQTIKNEDNQDQEP